MLIIPDKPKHGKYLFKNLTLDQYVKYARQYSKARRTGIQAVYGWCTNLGVVNIIKDATKNIIF